MVRITFFAKYKKVKYTTYGFDIKKCLKMSKIHIMILSNPRDNLLLWIETNCMFNYLGY